MRKASNPKAERWPLSVSAAVLDNPESPKGFWRRGKVMDLKLHPPQKRGSSIEAGVVRMVPADLG